MTLEQLRIFVAVAERQHVTRAAHALNLAQSAVSASIAALEERHATRLFDRVGRGIALTEAGRLFVAEAKAVLARAAAAERVLSELGGLVRGTLAVQASHTIAGYWLPRHLADFRRSHPGIAVRLSLGNTLQVAQAVHDGAAELGFVEGDIDDPALTGAPVARDQLVIVVAPNHPWAARAVTTGDLLHADWVMREPGSGTRSTFEAALQRLGLSPADLSVVLELPSNEAVRAAAEAGLGAAVMSASVAAPALEAGLLHRVALPLAERPFSAVWHRERYLGHAARALLGRIAATLPPAQRPSLPAATAALHDRGNAGGA
ncbi:MAG: LysR family transcriptional regulator [Alphaproteobacteria bacterium]|nr:LysR family transcriptional regulator [Alphaproteobacteria bacterium]